MKTITVQEYREHSHRSSDFTIPSFSFEEVQEFLNNLGYDIIVYTGKALVRDKFCDAGGDVSYGCEYPGTASDVFAVKPGTPFPELLQHWKHLRVNNVFQQEIKKKLLS